MRTIRLYGELGKRYGKVHKFHVSSVGEAVRLLCANFKDFRQFIESDKNGIAGYEVWDAKHNLDGEVKEDFCKTGEGSIKIIPRIVGASNAAKVIVGVALIAASWWAGGAAGWSYLGAKGFSATIATSMFYMGASVILTGVIGMMTKTASGSSIDSDDTSTQSYIFSGVANTTKQGNPVFIAYGEYLLGSQVISQSLTTSDIAI